MIRKILTPFAIGFLSLWMTGCFSTDKPVPIEFGKDACVTCRMTISDSRFGGEVISKGGKVFKFDALECMNGFMNSNREKVRKTYVVDFFADGSLIPVEDAQLVDVPKIRGPMGQSVVASTQGQKLKDLSEKQNSRLMNWNEWLREQASKSGSSSYHH